MDGPAENSLKQFEWTEAPFERFRTAARLLRPVIDEYLRTGTTDWQDWSSFGTTDWQDWHDKLKIVFSSGALLYEQAPKSWRHFDDPASIVKYFEHDN